MGEPDKKETENASIFAGVATSAILRAYPHLELFGGASALAVRALVSKHVYSPNKLTLGLQVCEPCIRALCAESLGRKKEEAAIPFLISALFDQYSTVANAAMTALEKMQPLLSISHFEGMLAMHGNSRNFPGARVVNLISKIGGKAAKDELLFMLKDKGTPSSLRMEIMRVLGKMGDKSVLDDIFAAIVYSEEHEAAKLAVADLMNGYPPLEWALQEKIIVEGDSATVDFAARTIGHYGKTALGPLSELMNTNRFPHRGFAKAIEYLAETDALDDLAKIVASTDYANSRVYVDIFARNHPGAFLFAAEETLQGDSDYCISNAIRSLGYFHGDKALELIERTLRKHPSFVARVYAASAMNIDGHFSRGALLDALSDPHDLVVSQARTTLSKNGFGPDAAIRLRKLTRQIPERRFFYSGEIGKIQKDGIIPGGASLSRDPLPEGFGLKRFPARRTVFPQQGKQNTKMARMPQVS